LERVNAILRHPAFVAEIERLDEFEKSRPFCGHGMDHLLDVARIALILNFETGFPADIEPVYAAALLHDSGRAKQYEDGTPHEYESARIAAGILPECGFDSSETAVISDAILAHRTGSDYERFGIAEHLYHADKLSRRCFYCAAREDCNWELKNQQLMY